MAGYAEFLPDGLAIREKARATPHNLTRRLSQYFCSNSKSPKWRNTVCARKGYAASVSQLVLATAAQYFSFFKLKKWGKKAAETRRHNCAVLPYIPFVNFRQADASSRRVLHDTMGQTDAMV